MEKYLEDSLALITSALENEDPDKLLSDFLAFEKNAVGPTCDEMNIQYNINFSKISNKVFTINDFMVTGHHFSDLSTISFNDLEKFINDFKTHRLLKNYVVSDNIRSLLEKHNIEIRTTRNEIIVSSNKIFDFNFSSTRYFDFTSHNFNIVTGSDSEYDGCVYDIDGNYYSIKCVYTPSAEILYYSNLQFDNINK